MSKKDKQDKDPKPARKRPGAPKGNQNGRRHGLYSKLYPVEFMDTFERLRREQGHPPLDPATARQLEAVTRDPRMNKRLLVASINAMRTMITFERAIRTLQMMRRLEQRNRP